VPLQGLNRLRRAAAVCFGLAIIVGSLSTGASGSLPLPDKLQHFLSYGGWMALVAASPRHVGRILAYAGVIVLVGLAIEAVQPFVGRQASVYDLLANLAGIAVGLAGGLALRSRLYQPGVISPQAG